MVSGATSLGLVRDELFSTMEEAEQSLEQFIAERHNGAPLQQAVESLQQVRGILNLIELVGAQLLAEEILRQAMDVPAGAGEERDGQLAALSNALYVLRRYLENVDSRRQELPELLLPAINDLRQAGGQAPLPESFFFSARLDQQRPPLATEATVALDAAKRAAQLRQLRHMYQIGLLGLLRDPQPQAGIKLMARALARLERLLGNGPQGRLVWIAAAALEAHQDGQLLPRRPRKLLFSRLDRELRQLGRPGYEAPRNLLKELLYLVALAGSHGPLSSQVREVFGLASLPFTDHLLEEEYQRLSGPGQEVMRSLSSAIREELTGVKDLLDLIERGSAREESFFGLHVQLGKLAKTLGMVGLDSACAALEAQLPVVAGWGAGQPQELSALNKLADAVLFVESRVACLERGERNDPQPAEEVDEAESFARHQLAEARIVVSEEARAGLAMAKRAITAYLESNGEKLHLANVPLSLKAVRGGLLFLEQARAAELIGACAEYIQKQMLEATQMPSEQMLETLADALTSLEYHLEGGGVLRGESSPSVLDLASDSVRALGLPVAA